MWPAWELSRISSTLPQQGLLPLPCQLLQISEAYWEKSLPLRLKGRWVWASCKDGSCCGKCSSLYGAIAGLLGGTTGHNCHIALADMHYSYGVCLYWPPVHHAGGTMSCRGHDLKWKLPEARGNIIPLHSRPCIKQQQKNPKHIVRAPREFASGTDYYVILHAMWC